jgi:hypothetical protein
MAFAQGSRSRLSFINEVTYGTTPSPSPELTVLPFNTHSLDLTKQAVESAEVRFDRMTQIFRHGNKSVSGDIEFDFRADDFDAVLESLFFNDFDTGVLEVGTTINAMTIEDAALDISEYRQYTGLVCSSGTFSFAPNQMVTLSTSWVGKNMTQAASSLDATPTAASTNQPFDSFTATLSDNSTELTIASAFSLTIDNGVAPTFVIGADTTPQIEYGRAAVSGSITLYYEDETLINKFLNETESSLELILTDPDGTSGNDYTILLPRIKYNGASVPVQSEQSRLITLPFISLYDTVEGTNCRITKS